MQAGLTEQNASQIEAIILDRRLKAEAWKSDRRGRGRLGLHSEKQNDRGLYKVSLLQDAIYVIGGVGGYEYARDRQDDDNR
jgi:hypothetical protein